jgi:flagellar hook assembly protein FlgD
MYAGKHGYVFGQDSLTNFKLYYGSPGFINEHLQSFRTELAENFPNPFREETTIRFILSQASDEYEVKLQVYSTSGQLINTLAEGIFSSGAHQVVWNGRDATGKKMPAGLYIYKLEVVSEGERKSFVRKMLLQ